VARQLDGSDAFSDLRLIILGGETVTPADVQLYRRFFPRSCLLHVGLGATETQVVRRFFIDHDLPVSSASVPVGYAVEDFEVSVVDSEGNRAAAGEIGEILIQSPFLALGYWRKPDLTATAFRQNPVNLDQRMYLTGDLGRMRGDGCLEHCGRRDLQVKVRGQRIELAEIENLLMSFGLFRDVAVVARAEANGNSRLVAYLVSLKSLAAPVDIAKVAEEIADRLPSGMVPSAYVLVDELPLTSSNKVDRRELARSPRFAPAKQGGSPPAHAGSNGQGLAETLAALWSKVLECGPVRGDDSFLALGGDSLRAMELAAIIERTLKRKLHWTVILRAPTPAQLALLLESPDTDLSRRSLRAAHGSDSESDPTFILVTGPIGRPETAGAREGRRLVTALPALGPVDPDQDAAVDRWTALARSLGPGLRLFFFDYGSDELRIEVLAQELVREIRRVQPSGPYRLGGFCYGSIVAFEAARILCANGERVSLLALIDSNGPGFPRYVTSRRDRIQARFRWLKEQPLSSWPQLLALRARALPTRAAKGIISRLWKSMGTPDEIPAVHKKERSAYFKRVFRYPGEIVLFRAARILYRAAYLSYDDMTNGWGLVADGGVRTIIVPGDHATIFDPPHIAELGRALRSFIDHDVRSPSQTVLAPAVAV
jgi:thioesterase domain-containing protein